MKHHVHRQQHVASLSKNLYDDSFSRLAFSTNLQFPHLDIRSFPMPTPQLRLSWLAGWRCIKCLPLRTRYTGTVLYSLQVASNLTKCMQNDELRLIARGTGSRERYPTTNHDQDLEECSKQIDACHDEQLGAIEIISLVNHRTSSAWQTARHSASPSKKALFYNQFSSSRRR